MTEANAADWIAAVAGAVTATGVVAGGAYAAFRWLRPPAPTLTMSIQWAAMANEPHAHTLIVRPPEWGSATILRIHVSEGLEIAGERLARDPYGHILPDGYEPWSRVAEVQREVDVTHSTPLLFRFGLRASRASLASSTNSLRHPMTGVVQVSSEVTNPIRRIVRNKIAINVPALTVTKLTGE